MRNTLRYKDLRQAIVEYSIEHPDLDGYRDEQRVTLLNEVHVTDRGLEWYNESATGVYHEYYEHEGYTYAWCESHEAARRVKGNITPKFIVDFATEYMN